MSFGPLVTGADVKNAVVATLQTRIETHLAERERATGRPARSLPVPRSYVTVFDVERWPEEQLPSVLVAVPGTEGRPVRDGGGRYRATWNVEITVIVSASSNPDELVSDYAGAIRQTIGQHSSLDVGAVAEWVGERSDVLGARNRRQLAAGTVMFEVEMRDVLDGNAGPVGVPPDPYEILSDEPVVEITEVQVTSTKEIP